MCVWCFFSPTARSLAVLIFWKIIWFKILLNIRPNMSRAHKKKGCCSLNIKYLSCVWFWIHCRLEAQAMECSSHKHTHTKYVVCDIVSKAICLFTTLGMLVRLLDLAVGQFLACIFTSFVHCSLNAISTHSAQISFGYFQSILLVIPKWITLNVITLLLFPFQSKIQRDELCIAIKKIHREKEKKGWERKKQYF